MKKYFVFIFAFIVSSYAYSQTNTVLFEDFQEDVFPPEGWSIVDHDGDGKNWYHRSDSQSDNKLASSKSWESAALTPHNLLITKKIDFTDFREGDRLRLRYNVAATGNNYFREHYKVVISTSNNSFNDFESGTILAEETITETESGWKFKTVTIDLNDYADQNFWVAWVHYNCTDQDALLIDNIHFYEGDDPEEPEPLPYTSWLIGDADDKITQNHQPGIVLAGGGGDNSDAIKWFLGKADGGDIVVLRASGSYGYNNYFYTSLGISVNSVETLLIDSREAAEHPYVEQQIRNAEALFIAGGDQYNYYKYWKDTPVMDAINYLINEKGVVVGGSSAGMAILGKAYYTPSGGSAVASVVLANPYHSSVDIVGINDFLDAEILENTITDTHFDQRARAGRLFTFMSRMVKDWGIIAKGIAANESTAVCIEPDGKAYVYGDPAYPDYAYFVQSTGCVPENCVSGEPLTWDCNRAAVKVYKILGQKTNPDYFDLTNWEQGTGGTWEHWYAVDGVFQKGSPTNVAINMGNTVTVYPNPASRILHISVGEERAIKVEIASILGQIIITNDFSNDTETLSVDISNLKRGPIVVRVYFKDGNIINSMVVVN
jgi:cyanophycinase-like exopeptidase